MDNYEPFANNFSEQSHTDISHWGNPIKWHKSCLLGFQIGF